ncbi:alpha-2-macroglobulin-like [Leptodactylus fuscus]|uniref:alpha-2-macroglobulin-like n=1 Tax=Leptodactylus fuscus TaxID=238119 RepID=UPI003F4E7CC7
MDRLLLCAALLSLLPWVRSELQYALTAPEKLISGETAQVCLKLLQTTEPLNISVTLEYHGKNSNIIAEVVVPPTYSHCSNIDVPSVPNDVPAEIIFSAKGSSTDLRQRKMVVINPVSDRCTWKLDKSTYKSGQTVQFQVICLNSRLQPVDQKFSSIYMQDPSKTKIAQWHQREANDGVVSLESKLNSDAPPGKYMITAERESGRPLEVVFTVEEYVLPKFDVDGANS